MKKEKNKKKITCTFIVSFDVFLDNFAVLNIIVFFAVEICFKSLEVYKLLFDFKSSNFCAHFNLVF